MVQLSLPAALAVITLWPAGILFCTWKYLVSYRSGRKLDAWIWFIAWCVIISMVEWFALACYILFQRAFGQ